MQQVTDEQKLSLIKEVEAFVFDCDGVIWRGDSLIDGVPETLDMLRGAGKKLIFVTNNATKSREGYKAKFTSLGLSVAAEEIYSSSYAAAAYLEASKFDKRKKVYVVGEAGIPEELDLLGIPHLGGPADAGKVPDMGAGGRVEHDPDVAAVVVGFDRHINYYKIQYATLCLRENEGCAFIATNPDAVTHLTDAQEWAGNGAMLGAIRGSSQREPTIVGKPENFMLQNIAERYGLQPSQMCMIGDRLDTDVQFGKRGGLRTALVLSGVTTSAQAQSAQADAQPDFVFSQLPDLLTVKGQL